jgi:hypothetical protein
MLMRKTALAALAAGSLIVTRAHALTGNDLLKDLREPDRTIATVGTTAYIRGFLDAASVSRIAQRQWGGQPLFCAPEGSTVEQAKDMVKQYLENNPGERHYDAGSIVFTVLGQAWSCP